MNILKVVAQSMAKKLDEILTPVVGRVRDLEKRMEALERETAAKSYCGVWDEARTYEQHNLCTFSGSIWVARRDTTDRPGTSDAWQLAVKKGRDAR